MGIFKPKQKPVAVQRNFRLHDIAGLEDHNKVMLIWRDQFGLTEYSYWDPETTIKIYKVLHKMFSTPLGKKALKDHEKNA